MPSAKSTLMGHQESDALSAPRKRSAQEELAAFQLLKEKMIIRSMPRGSIDEGARKVLGAMSEIELLTMKIAEKLSTDAAYSQSTAKYEQLARATGETEYIAMARYLANQIYEIKRGQMLLNEFSEGSNITDLAAERAAAPTLLEDPLAALAAALSGRA